MTTAEYVWIKAYVAVVASRPMNQRSWDDPDVEDIAKKAAERALENFKARFPHSHPESDER